MSGHVVPVKIYVSIFLALLALTALTTGVAFIDLGPFNTVVALGDCRASKCCWWSYSSCIFCTAEI